MTSRLVSIFHSNTLPILLSQQHQYTMTWRWRWTICFLACRRCHSRMEGESVTILYWVCWFNWWCSRDTVKLILINHLRNILPPRITLHVMENFLMSERSYCFVHLLWDLKDISKDNRLCLRSSDILTYLHVCGVNDDTQGWKVTGGAFNL